MAEQVACDDRPGFLECPDCGDDVFEADADGLFTVGDEAVCEGCGSVCRVFGDDAGAEARLCEPPDVRLTTDQMVLALVAAEYHHPAYLVDPVWISSRALPLRDAAQRTQVVQSLVDLGLLEHADDGWIKVTARCVQVVERTHARRWYVRSLDHVRGTGRIWGPLYSRDDAVAFAGRSDDVGNCHEIVCKFHSCRPMDRAAREYPAAVDTVAEAFETCAVPTHAEDCATRAGWPDKWLREIRGAPHAKPEAVAAMDALAIVPLSDRGHVAAAAARRVCRADWDGFTAVLSKDVAYDAAWCVCGEESEDAQA